MKRQTRYFTATPVVVLLVLTTATVALAHGERASKKMPFALGPDQTIIDLNKLEWAPLKGEGVPPGPEIATLRGDPKTGNYEAVVRLPANYTFPNHSHTSDEVYVWIKGKFTYIAADGTAIDLSGQTYISLPGGVPHAVVCGEEPCVFYLRYSRPFDLKIHPMPGRKK